MLAHWDPGSAPYLLFTPRRSISGLPWPSPERDERALILRICPADSTVRSKVRALISNRKVQVLLNTDGRDLCLEVTDNGRGIEQGAIAQPRSLGLVGMRERALALGGKVRFEGVKGKGTKVTVRVPLIATDVDEAGAICRRDRQKRQQAQSAPMCLNFPGRLDGQRIEPAAESQA